eukprot:901032_1
MSPFYAVIIILIAFPSTQSYIFYGDHTLEWNDGNAFCDFSFGTTLASIHNAIQDAEAGSKCLESTSSGYGCWIGATIAYSTAWKWRDGTPFHYGNDTSGGVAPWNTDNLTHTINESCIAIDPSTKKWNDIKCDDNIHILCNSPSNSPSIVIDDDSFGKMDILDDQSFDVFTSVKYTHL